MTVLRGVCLRKRSQTTSHRGKIRPVPVYDCIISRWACARHIWLGRYGKIAQCASGFEQRIGIRIQTSLESK